MPEGPEIRRAADEIASAVVGETVTEIYFAFDHLKPFEEILTGGRVQRMEAHGKALLTRFENGWNIYSHNQLYGLWIVRDAYDYPETNRKLRLAIHNAHKSALLYSATDIQLLRDDELATHPFLSKLGPNVLDERVTAVDIAARFLDKRFRRRGLISLLLDQKFLAGLGNYLRTEILFVARVAPTLRPMDCTDAQIMQLAEASLALSRQSYRTKGITNDLQLANRLKEQGVAYGDYRFWAFDRDDKPCYVCGQPIIKEFMGGRRLYYCTTCQE